MECKKLFDCIDELYEEYLQTLVTVCTMETPTMNKELIDKLGAVDDELAFLLATCYFELGRSSVRGGMIVSARKYLELSREIGRASCRERVC